MARLTDDEIAHALRELGTWTLHDAGIERTFACQSFADAMAAVVRLGFEAERADHHPDLTWSYRRVTLRFTTHSEGGITAKDVAGAREAERIFSAFV